MLRRFALHVSNYSAGSLLVVISGLISFPILTRVFTVEEYGVLNLISATLALLVGIAKLGVQHSIVRFYGEVKAHTRDTALAEYRATTFYGMLATGGIVALLWAVASLLLPASLWNDPRVAGLFVLTSVLILVRTLESCLTNFLRAEERSALFSVYSVARRYAGLAAVLLVLFFVARDLVGFYAATIATEAAAVVVLLALLTRGRGYPLRAVSPELYAQMLVFGLPMIAFELAGVLLSIGDRYVVQSVLGSTALGVYSAGYNFCEYVQMILLASVGQAITPMYVRYWEELGREPTRRFIRQVLHFYLMIAMPVIAGLTAVGEDALVWLASGKYRESAAVIPWVVAGMSIDGMAMILGAGLYIYKRTGTIAGLVAGCAVLNIVLNLELVPRLGITGAAVATLISYAALGASMLWTSRDLLAIPFPWASGLKFGAIAAAMYFPVVHLPGGHGAVALVARIAAGAVLYAAAVLALDEQARSVLGATLRRLRPGARAA
jgi:O-antigen/teichoic acid export membrane protein